MTAGRNHADAGEHRVAELATRRYLTRVVRRWAPGVALIAVALLVLAFVPPATPPESTDTTAGALGTARRGTDGTSGATGAIAGGDAPAAGDGATGATSGSPSTAEGSATGAGAGDSTTTGGAADGAVAVGVARSGVRCTAGVRQVTWSKYAPPCVPVFHGDNGGATAPGVTKDTIKVVYRISESGQSAAVRAAAGAAAGGTDEQYIADLQKYVTLFNNQYELYGRKVVLESYEGRGDWLAEVQGQNREGAQADAATARDMHAFADVSVVSMTQYYAESLADQGILSFGTAYMSQPWYDAHAPFAYSYWPTNTRFAHFTSNLVCQRLARLPASFAGDATSRATTRVFGLLTPENPVYASAGDELEHRLAACGVKVAKRVQYALNISTAVQQATSAVAQMRAAGVTTVLCGCDPIVPIFLTQAADGQGYHPEWQTLWWGDAYGRMPSQGQWSHAIAAGGASPKGTQTEAYRAFKLASQGSEPAEMYYNLPYWQALLLFNGIQAAGPNLNPATFARGFFSLPPSLPGGDFGPWSYGPGTFTPKSAFQVGWWDQSATSAYDGKQGAWQNCNGGTWYGFDDSAAFAPAGTQLDCFRR